MIFILSETINLGRKIFYVGLMLVVVSILFVSMIDFDNPARIELLSWISVLAILGVSLLFVTAMMDRTQVLYAKWGWISLVALAVFIPLLMSVLFYLVSIFASVEGMGERFIIHNTTRILLVTAPLLLIVEIALLRSSKSAVL